MNEILQTKSMGYLPHDFLQKLKNQPQLHEIIDITRFSDLHRLLRVIAYVRRFVNNYTLRFSNMYVIRASLSILETREGSLMSEEIQEARDMLICSEQSKYAQTEKANFIKLQITFVLSKKTA